MQTRVLWFSRLSPIYITAFGSYFSLRTVGGVLVWGEREAFLAPGGPTGKLHTDQSPVVTGGLSEGLSSERGTDLGREECLGLRSTLPAIVG